ncbi:type I restriction enzyme S subunit [Dokdonia sp. Hel_I_63]|uniref:restriction endonuclease subunit S n=1 Tax=Dokdonia sp. Hel_I_63 TaxID=1249996 RepID=UPI00119AA4FB|nr:restriction endonuclease subunit S [Dokdonia sp. Hel_I_63]TVZ23448.1 type I restriction enzyme S subunit [Dokdonia sp. Hel_I_63]
MQLLQHFKELTLRPKNAQELKGLILQLAIQGKLTANWRKENPNVEPASELLKKIQKEKEQLVKDKKINKEKSLPKLIEDEIPYKIPAGWNWCRLRDTGFTQTGSTPPKKNPENYGDFIPFIGPADISNHSMKYPVSGLSELGISIGRLIPKDSIMMVCIGGSIGKCNINEVDVSCNQQINTVTPVFMPAVYVKVICQSPYFQKSVLDKASGSATPIINKGKWETLPIPIPPLQEQKEIVNVVETLFKEVEQLEQLTVARIGLKEDFVTSALQQLTTNSTNQEWINLQEHFKSFFNETTNIKKLRETILQLAVQGKLTADWRSNHPELVEGDFHAQKLLDRIQKEKAQLIADKKIKKEKALPPITEDKIPYELPEGWVWSKLGMISLIVGGGTPKSSNPEYFSEEGISWFTPADLGKSKTKYVERGRRDITKLGLEKSSAQLMPKGSVMFSSRAPIGHTAIGLKDFSTNQGFKSSVPYFMEMNEYIYIYLNSIVKDANENASGTTFKEVSGTIVKNFLFPLPPLEEQKAIVEKVNALMGLCDALEQEVQQSQQHSEMMMQSVLKEIFEGRKEVAN